jgi:hypothetical protein
MSKPAMPWMGKCLEQEKKADFFDFELLISLSLPDTTKTQAYREWAESWPSEFRKLTYKQEQISPKGSPELVLS